MDQKFGIAALLVFALMSSTTSASAIGPVQQRPIREFPARIAWRVIFWPDPTPMDTRAGYPAFATSRCKLVGGARAPR